MATSDGADSREWQRVGLTTAVLLELENNYDAPAAANGAVNAVPGPATIAVCCVAVAILCTRNFRKSPATPYQISMSALGNTITTVVVYHRPNLIQNSEFHLGSAASGANAIPGWQALGGGFYNAHDNSNGGNGSGGLWTNNQANSGAVFQTGIGSAATDLTGMAFDFSLDVKFQNGESDVYDANTHLAIAFYGADDQTLTHQATDDFQTPIIPALGIDATQGTDSVYRTFRTGRYVAPAGTRYVRPVIRYGDVDSDSTNWVFFDNAYLQEAHPVPDAREWLAAGSGDWSNNRNWMQHALVENNLRVYFGNAITQDSTVTVSSPQCIQGLTFFSEHDYQLQGAGDLTIGDASETSVVDVRFGNHRISVASSLAGAVDLQVLSGASIRFDATLDLNGQELTKLGAGVLDLASGFAMHGGQITSYTTAAALISVGPAAVLNGDFELLLAPGRFCSWAKSLSSSHTARLLTRSTTLSCPHSLAN